MIKDIIKVMELAKELIGYFSEFFGKRKITDDTKSYDQYMINSCKRKQFNNINLSNVEITYIFKDCPDDEDSAGLDIEYILKGKALDKLNHLLFYLNMKENSSDNFSFKAYDCADEKEYQVRISKANNTDEVKGKNGAYWEIPFYNRRIFHMDKIWTKILLSWKSVVALSDELTLIIDPRNYAKNTNNVTITVNNEADNFDIEYINIEEYNRKTRKILKNGLCQIYDSNNDTKEITLVNQRKLFEGNINENSLFLMKVKCKNKATS